MLHRSANTIFALCTILATLLPVACTSGEFAPPSDAARAAVPANGTPTQPMAGGNASPSSAAPSLTPMECPNENASAPEHLACTGLYDPKSELANGVREYAPAYALWTDGAQKRRFILLPSNATIDNTRMDEWVFPIGTKLWKEFALDGKRIETRFMWKTNASSWVQASYRWNDAQTDAVRLDAGAVIDRGAGRAAYEIPAVGRCDDCHGGREDKVLGFEAVLLGLPGAKGVTLTSLANEGRLARAPAASWFVIPDDGTQAPPALGWLHANCGVSCHNTSPNALAKSRGMVLRLSYDELNPPSGPADLSSFAVLQTTLQVVSSLPAGADLFRIAPGDTSGSAITTLAGRRDPTNPMGQMPPLGTRVTDADGVGAVERWIANISAR